MEKLIYNEKTGEFEKKSEPNKPKSDKWYIVWMCFLMIVMFMSIPLSNGIFLMGGVFVLMLISCLYYAIFLDE